MPSGINLFLISPAGYMLSTAVLAGNGSLDIGYGPESASMAGAEVGLVRNSFSLATNPAGLAQVENHLVDVMAEPYYFVGNRHSDQYGNDEPPARPAGLMVAGGYARRLSPTVVLATGAFVQGGSGFHYDDLQTPFGTRDEMSSQFGAYKLVVGGAYQATDRLNLGGGIGLVYATAIEKVLPNTSTETFSGFRVDGLQGISLSGRLSIQYRPISTVTVGMTYATKTKVNLKGGEVRVNSSGSGQGEVRYDDAKLEGLAFPQEISVGALINLGPQWGVAGKVTWLDWSAAMHASSLTAQNPSNSGAPPVFVSASPLNWRDQYLAAIGASYHWSDQLDIRFGYSRGRNPIPPETVSLLLPEIDKSSLTVGTSYRFRHGRESNTAVVYQPPVTLQYNSPLLGNSRERWECLVGYFGVTRRW